MPRWLINGFGVAGLLYAGRLLERWDMGLASPFWQWLVFIALGVCGLCLLEVKRA